MHYYKGGNPALKTLPLTWVLCSPLDGQAENDSFTIKLASREFENQIQQHTVDHLAGGLIKNGATFVM